MNTTIFILALLFFLAAGSTANLTYAAALALMGSFFLLALDK